MASVIPSIIGAGISLIGANKAQKAKNKELAQQQAMFDWEKNLYDTYSKPEASIGLGQVTRSQASRNNLQSYFDTYAGGGNTETSNLPDWLKSPVVGGDQYNKTADALSTLADTGLEATAKDQAASRAKLMASRGVPISAEQTRLTPGFDEWYRTAASEEKAQKALTLDQLQETYRNNAKSNVSMLGNYLASTAIDPTSVVSQGMNLASGQASSYGNTASQEGATASQAGMSFGSQLGDIFSKVIAANKKTKKTATATAGG
jgi:hypothetical protein